METPSESGIAVACRPRVSRENSENPACWRKNLPSSSVQLGEFRYPMGAGLPLP